MRNYYQEHEISTQFNEKCVDLFLRQFKLNLTEKYDIL